MKRLGLLLFIFCFATGCATLHHGHDAFRLQGDYSHLEGKYLKIFKVDKNILEKELARQIQKQELFDPTQAGNSGTTESAKYPDILLEISFMDPKLALVEKDYMSSVFSWLFTAFLTFWVHTHRYEVDFVATIKISDKKTKKLIYMEEYPVKYQDYLNFHERIDGILSYFLVILVPPVFITSDEDEVLTNLVSPAMGQVVFRLKWIMLNLKNLKSNPLVSSPEK